MGGASAGDVENVFVFLDSDNNATPESLGNASCSYDVAAVPPGCSVTQSIIIPTVTEDTTYRGRVMLSYNDLVPANGCGDNTFGDSEDYIIVANVNETITLVDVSAPEDGGAITLTATLSHNVRDASGFLPFTVDYATGNGTATIADGDYIATGGTLTFNGQAGDTETFTITPTADIVPEGDQTLIVSLLNLSNSKHGIDITDTGTVTLEEDDTEVMLELEKLVDDESPNVGSTVLFTLRVSNASPDAAINATVQDTVPAGFASISSVSVPTGTTFNVVGNVIDWTGVDVPAGGSVLATYTAVVVAP